MAVDGVLVMWILREILHFARDVMGRNSPSMEEKHASNQTRIAITAIKNNSDLIE